MPNGATTSRRATRQQEDMFPNILTRRLTLSAANTLTFDAFDIGLNLFDKAALLIQRVEYIPQATTIELMTASGDDIQMAITTSDAITSISQVAQGEVVDSLALLRMDFGTAASGEIRETVLIHDFANMKGGGLLIAPKPLFFAGMSNGLASAAVIDFRVYFVVFRLNDSAYLELLQTRSQFGP